jgi:riboflavin-specific deaminase-like protein
MKIERLFADTGARQTHLQRPVVTLSYAQSIDGSIAVRRGKRLSLSGRESFKLWHQLRSWHDAILVGIGTVLADDPRLTVRLVQGDNPQPVILDSNLRYPLRAHSLRNKRAPWIITKKKSDLRKQLQLEKRGARVISIKSDRNRQIDLNSLLIYLSNKNVNTLMVEGGARVITSFLRARLVDRFVVTITPALVGGLHAVEQLLNPKNIPTTTAPPRLTILGSHWYGRDLVLWGKIDWRR